jgi:hypothetical protein
MQDAGLHHRARPDHSDRIPEPSQAIADRDAHIRGAPILDLRQHRQPILRAFTADAGPDPQHVAVALDGDADDDVERPVGDLPVADLQMDGVDEDHRVDRVE